MTADVELLPCGECGMPCRAGEYHPFAACLMFKACRNSETVRANLAPLQAENERLRAEVERLRADRDSWEQQASDRVADWYAEHLRAERLAEALRKVAQALDWYAHGRCRGFDDGPLLSTSEAIELAEHTLANALGHDDAAPAKENSND